MPEIHQAETEEPHMGLPLTGMQITPAVRRLRVLEKLGCPTQSKGACLFYLASHYQNFLTYGCHLYGLKLLAGWNSINKPMDQQIQSNLLGQDSHSWGFQEFKRNPPKNPIWETSSLLPSPNKQLVTSPSILNCFRLLQREACHFQQHLVTSCNKSQRRYHHPLSLQEFLPDLRAMKSVESMSSQSFGHHNPLDGLARHKDKDL